MEVTLVYFARLSRVNEQNEAAGRKGKAGRECERKERRAFSFSASYYATLHLTGLIHTYLIRLILLVQYDA